MAIRVVYLGKLSDVAGTSQSDLAPNSGELDWAALLKVLRQHVNAEISDAAKGERTLVAVNGKVLADKTALAVKDGDEVALLPPVSGG